MIIAFNKKKTKSCITLALLNTSFLLTLAYADDPKQCAPYLKLALKDPELKTSPQGSCSLTHKLINWVQLQKKGSFPQIREFITKNPNWPRQDALHRQAEKDISSHRYPAQQITTWFKEYPPLTVAGLKTYAQAVQSINDQRRSLGQALLTCELTPLEFVDILKKFPSSFEKNAIFLKASQYLNSGESFSFNDIRPLLTKEDAKIIDSRLKIRNKQLTTKSLPLDDFSDDARKGVLLEQIRVHRKSELNDEAKTLLENLVFSENDVDSAEASDPLRWAETAWTERNLIARRYLEERSYQKAYDIIQGHGLSRGENFANAEFLSGWIALRYLKKPELALSHFEKLHQGVKSPISVARAQYWIARTHKDLGNVDDSKNWYKKAQLHQATYYGQLAQKELSGETKPIRPKSLPVDQQLKKNFDNHEFVKIINILTEAGAHSHVDSFALKLATEFDNHKEQTLLVDHLYHKLGPSTALKIYKKTQKDIAPVIPAAYPQIGYIPKKTVSPAFAHAIIRQESRFQHDAVSSAGAVGLMQLMPATALRTTKANKVKAKKLTDPQHNVHVGCLHLKELLDKYSGSMILAAAAYNAGSSAVDKWITLYGDPRKSGVDSADWVENIPYAETRNYVQRVMENYHCYR